METSEFKLVSIGLVHEMKPRGERQCNVIKVEDSSALDGETAYNPQTKVLKGTDKEGKEYNVKATTEAGLIMEWLPSEDNRVTPPDMVRGELVEVWQMSDGDKYFWRCLGLRNGLRSLESVIWMVGATPDIKGHGMDFSKAYIFQMSGHDKHITIATSKDNGEPHAWTFQINTGQSEFTLKDDIDNEFEIVSADNRLQLKNADGTYIKIERQFIEMDAAQYIQLKVGGTVMKLTPDAYTLKTTNDTVTSTNSKHTTSTRQVTASSYKVEAAQVSFVCGTFAII
jgi:hypothetical protein